MKLYPYSRILLGNKREQNTHTYKNVDECQMHVAEWKTSDSIIISSSWHSEKAK